MQITIKTKIEQKPLWRSPIGWLPIITALGGVVGPACDTGNEDDVSGGGDGDADGDSDTDTGGGPYTTALVVTTDRQTGAYATISLENYDVQRDINFIHSDAVCRFDPLTGSPFILLRLGSDAVDVLDSNTFDIKTEYSVEASSNPQDIVVVSEERAVISRFGMAEMLIVNPFTGKEIGTVDLHEYADADGIPEVSGLVLFEGKILAPVQRLDRDNSWDPVGGGAIVIIDAETGDVEKQVRLTGTRSYETLEYSEALEQFVIAEPGSWSDLENAGIELFDPERESLSGFIITEETLGGNVAKALIISETKGYAIVGVAGDEGSDTHLVTFNPETGEKTGTVLEGTGWVYGDIAVTPDLSELWVADRTTEDAGVRIFDTKTDEEKTDEPINVGLPPSNICFTK
jgi:hypothetical protein